MVKKLEESSDVKTPWALATYMRKKGYKMPAAEEKYKLPTSKEEKEFGEYEKRIHDKAKGLGLKEIAEEESDERRELRKSTEKIWDAPEPAPKKPKQTRPVGDLYSSEEDVRGPTPDVGEVKLPTSREEHDLKHFRTQVTGKKKALGIPGKAEEDMSIKEKYYKKPESVKKQVTLPATPREQALKTPKGTSGFILPKGKSLQEWASTIIDGFLAEEKKDDDMLVYPEEFKMGMKEELEHTDVIGQDKEALKKIVLAHLKEDPKYYTKLSTVMKAEEEVHQKRMIKQSPDYKMLPDLSIKKKMPSHLRHGPVKEDMGEGTGYIGEEEKEGLVDKIKSTIKDLTTSPKVAPYKKDPPLTKKNIRQNFQHQHGASEIIDDFLAEEEERKPSQYAFTPYSKKELKSQGVVTVAPPKGKPMQRPPSPPMSKPLPKSDDPHTPKVKAAPVMSPKTEQLRQQFAVGKPKSQTVTHAPIKPSTIDIQDKPLEVKKPMEHKGEEDRLIPHYKTPVPKQPETKLSPKDEIESFLHLHQKKAEEDNAMDYVESLKKRKSPLTSPKGPTPKTEADLPSERLSAQYLNKAGEALGEPKKAFDEDALNELYCFLRWMSDKGFKAEDGDKFEQYMDQYEVEQYGKKAEEAMPPAQFKAPEEKK